VKGSKVAKRYARALIELAADQKQLEAWGAEVERLAAIVSAPEISSRIGSPELPIETRVQAIAKITERMELSFPLRSFAVVVARHNRIAEMSSISEAYQALADEALGRARATVTFARKPSQQDIEKISEALGAIVGKKIIPTVKVDESLLGGVVAELEGKIYDGSLAARLAEAQQRLSGQS
jgi:F-type H+-transporting ATPase subunit delta